MEGRTPILIDFGLARVADDVRLTRTGWLLGTPGYIAPETLHGEDATTAADVHGWAATVAFAGTGRAPFGRGPSMAIMDRVRRGQHDLGGLDPRMLPLVSRGLDPDPARRPPLAEVLHALGAVPTSPARTDRRRTPHPAARPGVAAVVARPGGHRAAGPARPVDEPADPTPGGAADARLRRGPHDVRRPAAEPSAVPDPTAGGPGRGGRDRAGPGRRPVRRRLDPGRVGGPAAARVRRRAVPPGPAGPHRAGRRRHRRGRRAVPHRDRARRAGGAAPRHVA